MYGLQQNVRVAPVIPVFIYVFIPFVLFVFFVCRKLSPHLRVWELDHRCLLSLCCVFGRFCMLCGRVTACNLCASCPLVCCACLHQYDVCKNYVGSVYVGGYGGLSKSRLCVFRPLYPVSFLVVGESPSVLL